MFRTATIELLCTSGSRQRRSFTKDNVERRQSEEGAGTQKLRRDADRAGEESMAAGFIGSWEGGDLELN
jgi:hypothetical protein